MNCFKCGNEIPDESQFCPKCGVDLSNADKLPCPKCSAYSSKEFVFCPKCGARMDGKHICIKCQTELPEDSSFCPKCGTGINAEAAQNSGLITKPKSATFNNVKTFCKETIKDTTTHDYIRIIASAIMSIIIFFLMFAPVIKVNAKDFTSGAIDFSVSVSPIQIIEAGLGGELDPADFQEKMEEASNEISRSTLEAFSRGDKLTSKQKAEISAALNKVNFLNYFRVSEFASVFKISKNMLTISGVIALLLVLVPLLTLLLSILGLIRKKFFKCDFSGLVSSFCLWFLLLFSLKLFDKMVTPGSGFIAVITLLSIYFLAMFGRKVYSDNKNRAGHLYAIRNAAVAVMSIVLVAVLTGSIGTINFNNNNEKKATPSVKVEIAMFLPLLDMFLDETQKSIEDNTASQSIYLIYEQFQLSDMSKNEFIKKINASADYLFFRESMVYDNHLFYYVSAIIPFVTLFSGVLLLLAAGLLLASVLSGNYKKKLFSTVALAIAFLFTGITMGIFIASTNFYTSFGINGLEITYSLAPTIIVGLVLTGVTILAGLIAPGKPRKQKEIAAQ